MAAADPGGHGAAAPGGYVGSELDLFSAVVHWKAYWVSQIAPLMHGDTLEVGAGIGANTRLLDDGRPGRWVCLEPDAQLCERIRQGLAGVATRHRYEVRCGTLASMQGESFDTILYIDVLEHIEDDRGELARAATLLRPGGVLIVLSPAHQWLYSPFDAAIGHFRRYDRPMLEAIAPAGLAAVRLRYVDSAGMALSAANKLLLRQSMPTAAQLQVWDRWVIPVSRLLDPLLGYRQGKTIIGAWQKSAAEEARTPGS
jgi:SAM-dependent methyltransferase